MISVPLMPFFLALALAGNLFTSGVEGFSALVNTSNLMQPAVRQFIQTGIPTPNIPPTVVDLGLRSPSTSSVAACHSACLRWRNASDASARCKSFTHIDMAYPIANLSGKCFGHVDDPVWLPVPNYPFLTSGIVDWPCVTDDDCSLNGKCSNGRCNCSSGWTGHRCETLDLLPVDRSQMGFAPKDKQGRQYSSWGGSVWQDGSEDTTYHMYAARMKNFCGINSWLTNSMIVHAVSKNGPLGPYVEKDIIFDSFAHEPDVAPLPLATGSKYKWVMVGVHAPLDNATTPFCHCTELCTEHGNCTRCDPVPHPILPLVAFSTSQYGPWIPQPTPLLHAGDSNLAVWVAHKTGAVYGLTRGGQGGKMADQWANVSSWRTCGEPSCSMLGRPDAEDPFIWQDQLTGHWHALLHNLEGPHMCKGVVGGCQVGTHAYSRDGNRWVNGGTAYTSRVNFTDGSYVWLNRRERPHLVFKRGTTNPVALSNSAETAEHGGDLSFTLVQGLRSRE